MNATDNREPIAWLDGRLRPISEAKLSVFDLGLVLGASVTEMVRSFRHRAFRLEAHLDRLYRSLRAVGFPSPPDRTKVNAAVSDVVAHNEKLIPDEHDLGIVIFVTAGKNVTYLGLSARDACRQPTACVHTFPLPFEMWADAMTSGRHLVTPSIRHIPPESLDPKIKSRSRLHWYLADQQARLVDPEAGSLVLNRDGNITENSTGNFFLVADSTIITPPPGTALGGVSQQVVFELADAIGVPIVQTDIRPYDVFVAEEAFTSSTPYCLMPVTRFNGRAIGDGKPGPVFGRLMTEWNRLVDLDIMEQIRIGAEQRRAETSTT